MSHRRRMSVRARRPNRRSECASAGRRPAARIRATPRLRPAREIMSELLGTIAVHQARRLRPLDQHGPMCARCSTITDFVLGRTRTAHDAAGMTRACGTGDAARTQWARDLITTMRRGGIVRAPSPSASPGKWRQAKGRRQEIDSASSSKPSSSTSPRHLSGLSADDQRGAVVPPASHRRAHGARLRARPPAPAADG